MQKYFITSRLLATVFLMVSSIIYAQFDITRLQTDYQVTPLGMDVQKPVFSWQMKANSNLRALSQKAYQIKVTNETGAIVWDSKRIESNISVGIVYNGEDLKSTTRYNWKVSVWNQDGKESSAASWFETGLMNPDPKLSGWNGANWIGGTDKDMVLYSHYLTVFRLSYTIQLDQKSKSDKAGFIFGANDERLMDRNMNILDVENKKDSSYVKVELNITDINSKQNGRAKLNIYRVGYTKNDNPAILFKTFEIPLSIINQNNKYSKHEIFATSVFGVLNFYVDGNDSSHNITADNSGHTGVNINPLGRGADYIAYPIVGDIGFALNKGQKAYFSNVKIMNFRAPSNTLFSEDLSAVSYNGIFSSVNKKTFSAANGQYTIDATSEEALIIANPTQNASPILRTEFKTEGKTIKKARLYATARGIYELYLNGDRIGNEYFSPGLTQYNKTQLYQTYDVTPMVLENGANAFGAILSEGWWSGNITYTGENWNFFGDRQSLLAKLVITYTDGSEQIVTTNPETWKYCNDGPIRYGSFFQGEIYDASKESTITDWSKANFNDSKWTKTQVIELKDKNNNKATVNSNLDFSAMELRGIPGVTATITKTLKPVSAEEVRPGVFVYDMGQNMVGFPKIELENTAKGDTIMIRYAEVKYPDIAEYGTNKGMIMLENFRAAMVRDIYYCKGTNDIIQPRFTFHGFRFIEITGIKKALPLDKITGMVLSSIDSITADYQTSNPLVNKLWKNIEWSTRSNFLYIPTDTPARNERMGWSGDISVFSKTATYLANAGPFLRRHMLAMRDLQEKDGRFTDTAPVTDAFGGILWGSAGIIVAWESYLQYGDVSLLAEHYDAMKRYIHFLKKHLNPITGVQSESLLGDWLSPEGYKNDDTILWDAYYAYDLEIMQKTAALLGKTDDAMHFEQEYTARKDHFNKTHIDAITGKTVHSGHRFPWGYRVSEDQLPKKGSFSDTQASYAIPLSFNLFDKNTQDKAANNLVATLERKNKDELGIMRPEYSLMTGFIGTAAISDALSKNGRDKEAYQLLQQTSYPSWLYSVENGATTIWERLNSYTKENGFGGNNNMNSFNHYSFGSVGAWMINNSIGIARDEPGFKKFILQPTPDPTGKITFAKGHYDSMYGKITSEWEIIEGQTIYTMEIPANTTASLFIKASSINKVTESGKKIKQVKGITFIGQKGDKLAFTLQSGTYKITVEK
ncbi:alpha-L-rhamnosidase [Flavobacterium sp. 1]|uniref:alpha-L-rhamnosidase n=1 Tax=Flavobacterium sp. 1 TaxID=2035200 RepID=UPI000C241CEF|nr:alpha-L-rhamnosidase [Flavobacterium sp. 1]PJJ09369.1 alpha-L-rhamnosidase [Flavobacterium sp. 1]